MCCVAPIANIYAKHVLRLFGIPKGLQTYNATSKRTRDFCRTLWTVI